METKTTLTIMTTLLAIDMTTTALCQDVQGDNKKFSDIDVICPNNYVRRIQECEPHYSKIVSALEQVERAGEVPAELQEEFEGLVKKVCVTPVSVTELEIK
jgi:hypothetical protein